MLIGNSKRVWIDEVWGEVLVRGISRHPTSTCYQADREVFWKPWNVFKDMITSKIVGWQCYSHSKPFSCVKHSHSQVHMKLYNTFQNADMKKGWLFWQPQYLIALTWACHSLWCNPGKRQRQRLLTPVAVHNVSMIFAKMQKHYKSLQCCLCL